LNVLKLVLKTPPPPAHSTSVCRRGDCLGNGPRITLKLLTDFLGSIPGRDVAQTSPIFYVVAPTVHLVRGGDPCNSYLVTFREGLVRFRGLFWIKRESKYHTNKQLRRRIHLNSINRQLSVRSPITSEVKNPLPYILYTSH